MNGQCSLALLESALAGSLSDEEEAALHRHLEECGACIAAMEQMSGGSAWCQEAASLLVEDDLDAAVPSREQWSEVDFTVEHLDPADDSNLLGRLGGYDVLQIIGRGGMGIVLKGFDRELKRSVAIKVLAPHLAQNSLARKRFAREAQAAAAVVHPHVVAIHQVQAGGRLPFLVMPLVAGESLAERLKVQGTLELKEILRIGMQAAAGLAAAHEQGLVHRDVKPANILLEKGVERAVLTDFGLACAADDVTLTRWGIIAGTPPYMSPEQARGEPLDGRSDLFSLGCVLYEMATGVSPFLADSVVATIRRLVDDPPQAMASLNPELAPWFIALVERLLEKDPAQRFNSAKEVSELLEGCLAHVQQPASVPLPTGLPKSPPRRGWRFNLGIKGVLTMIGALGIGLFGVLLATSNPPDIAGQWNGEDWGTVVLTKISDTEYSGTYSETVGTQASVGSSGGPSVIVWDLAGNVRGTLRNSNNAIGEIHLKWSRIERRFNGTWREREDRFGELSVRLVGDEIRGALTTDARSRINPATPRLADLKWTKSVANAMLAKTFSLRHRLAGDMVKELGQILDGATGHSARASADDQDVIVLAPPDVMSRVQTFITVMDWPDKIARQPNYEYTRDTELRTVRSFFYACAIEDVPEVFSKLLSPFVLAHLKGDTKSNAYDDYLFTGRIDPEWEKSLRNDWPGKNEAIQRFVREWNRYPLKRLTDDGGISISFGMQHFCTASFEGAPEAFYRLSVRPDGTEPDGKGEKAFCFSDLPPRWMDKLGMKDDKPTADDLRRIRAAKPGPPLAVDPAPRDLIDFRGKVGQSYLFIVPGRIGPPVQWLDLATGKPSGWVPGFLDDTSNPYAEEIWGTDVYTDDSSLATAAVHAGLLQPGTQTVLRVTILPGQQSYEGSTRHGITSHSYGAWGRSFRIDKPTADDLRRIRADEPPKVERRTYPRGADITPPIDFRHPQIALEWFRKFVAAEGMLSDARRPTAESLLQRLTILLDEYAQLSEVYGPSHPKLAELESKIASVATQISALRPRPEPPGVAPPAGSGSANAWLESSPRSDHGVAPPSSPRRVGTPPDKHAFDIAQAELEKARVAVESAKRNAARMAGLAAEQAIDNAVVEEAEAKVRMAEAGMKVARARLDALSAPDSEKLSEVHPQIDFSHPETAIHQLRRFMDASFLDDAKGAAAEKLFEQVGEMLLEYERLTFAYGDQHPKALELQKLIIRRTKQIIELSGVSRQNIGTSHVDPGPDGNK